MRGSQEDLMDTKQGTAFFVANNTQRTCVGDVIFKQASY